MKRSRMLKIIEKLFDIPRFPKDKKLTADLVLIELERAGMLPPTIPAVKLTKCHLAKIVWEHEGDFNEWEPE